MLLDLVTISEAESKTGIARSTVIRWLNTGRMKKRAQGKIAFSDIERCVREQRTGRPCMSGRGTRPVMRYDYRTLAEKNMEPYCGPQGLRRLRGMIQALAWEVAERGGDLSKLRDVLVDALAETKNVEDRYAHLVKLYGRRKRPPGSLRNRNS
jgi:hypothetical protein